MCLGEEVLTPCCEEMRRDFDIKLMAEETNACFALATTGFESAIHFPQYEIPGLQKDNSIFYRWYLILRGNEC